MLDPTTLPVLLKSLDFLYDEYAKLLAERRQRRQEEREAKSAQAEAEVDFPVSLPAPTKQDALSFQLDSAQWTASQTQIEHLTQLLDIHYGNYRHLSKQHAQWGPALVPPMIVSSLAHEEKEIEKLTQELQEALLKLYGKDPA